MDLKESKRLIEEVMKANQNLENENIALEMEVKASQKIIHKLKRDNQLLEEYEEAIIDKDDLIRKFEKGKIVASNVIRNLKEELNLKEIELAGVKKMLEEKDKLNSDNECLEKEILEIQKDNNLKEENLKAIETELICLKDKLAKVKEKNISVNEIFTQTDDLKCCSQEVPYLGGLDCKICNLNFQNISELEKHMKLDHSTKAKFLLESKLKELENKLRLEKLHLSEKLIKLKESEIRETTLCHCKRFCRIFHSKHYWKRSKADEIFHRLKHSQKSF